MLTFKYPNFYYINMEHKNLNEKKETIEQIFDDCRLIALAIKNNTRNLQLMRITRAERISFVEKNLDFFFRNEELVDSSDYKYFRDSKKAFIKRLEIK